MSHHSYILRYSRTQQNPVALEICKFAVLQSPFLPKPSWLRLARMNDLDSLSSDGGGGGGSSESGLKPGRALRRPFAPRPQATPSSAQPQETRPAPAAAAPPPSRPPPSRPPPARNLFTRPPPPHMAPKPPPGWLSPPPTIPPSPERKRCEKGLTLIPLDFYHCSQDDLSLYMLRDPLSSPDSLKTYCVLRSQVCQPAAASAAASEEDGDRREGEVEIAQRHRGKGHRRRRRRG